MTLRRVIALVLLLTVAVSSAEVLLASDAPPVASEIASSVHVASHVPAPVDGSIPDDCTCLCACGCVNAQQVVGIRPVAFYVTGVEVMREVPIPAVFANRARARPDLRPPLA